MNTKLLTLVVMLCAPGMLAAQTRTPAVPSPVIPPRTDVHAAFVMQKAALPNTDAAIELRSRWYSETPASVRVTLGHLWTTHFKTEFTIQPTPIAMNGFEQETLATPIGYPIYTQREASVVRTGLSAIYQFGDNDFTHPFVEAGLALDYVRIRRYRMAETRTVTVGSVAQTISISGLDERSADLQAGTFIGVGSKSYFTRRVFARPEFVLNWTPGAPLQPSASFGFGFDF